MSKINRYDELCKRTKKDYPRFNVRERDKSWLRPIFWLLRKITKQDYNSFTTTIFSTMYVGPGWDKKSSDDKYKTLRHEKVHVRQFHCFPLGRWAWPINHVLMSLCYLLLLPVILTFRARFEREGYLQTLLVEYELKGKISVAAMSRNAKWIGETFGGSTYCWMWRRSSAEAWAVETQRKINEGKIANPDDCVP